MTREKIDGLETWVTAFLRDLKRGGDNTGKAKKKKPTCGYVGFTVRNGE